MSDQTVRKRSRGAPTSQLRFDFLSVLPTPASLDRDLQELQELNYFGGCEEAEFAKALFDPDLGDARELPLGILQQKEEALPPDMVPNTREGLERLFRALVNRNGDECLIDLVVEGWPGSGRLNKPTIESHARDMITLAQSDDQLFRLMVCGQHAEALRRGVEDGLPDGFSPERFLRMFVRMCLLWAAHDVQLVVAQLHIAEHRPLGSWPANAKWGCEAGRWFIGEHRIVAPSAVVRASRRPYRIAQEIAGFQGLPATEQARRGKALLRRNPALAPIYACLEKQISPETQEELKHAVPMLLKAFPAYLDAHEASPFFAQISGKADTPLSGKTFPMLWCSGLTSVQASAVAIWRLVQLEREIEGMVRDAISTRRSEHAIRLPAFRRCSHRGGRKRVKELLNAYRRVLLRDKDFGSVKRKAHGGEANVDSLYLQAPESDAGGPAIRKAAKFLEKRGRRRIEDHAGGPNSARRTFYILDVLPDVRLSRGRLPVAPEGWLQPSQSTAARRSSA